MKKPPPERLFVVDLGLARKLDEWIACKPKRVRLWLEIKDYVDEYGQRDSARDACGKGYQGRRREASAV
jgi:hypothetical protein